MGREGRGAVLPHSMPFFLLLQTFFFLFFLFLRHFQAGAGAKVAGPFHDTGEGLRGAGGVTICVVICGTGGAGGVTMCDYLGYRGCRGCYSNNNYLSYRVLGGIAACVFI